MLSIGIALFDPAKSGTEPVEKFYRTICPQPGAQQEAACMEFWKDYPAQWALLSVDAVAPSDAMRDLSEWLDTRGKTYNMKWVAAPSNFDWMFLKVYYEVYKPKTGAYSIGFFCHDLTSLIRAYAIMHGLDTSELRERLAGDRRHTHNALEDACRQGVQYCTIRALLEEGAPARTPKWV
jgi:hypothetical protein